MEVWEQSWGEPGEQRCEWQEEGQAEEGGEEVGVDHRLRALEEEEEEEDKQLTSMGGAEEQVGRGKKHQS